MKNLVAILLLCLFAAPAAAGNRYYTRPLRYDVVYVIPLYPVPTYTHGLSTRNRPPYNPIFDGGYRHVTVRPANKPGPIVTKGRAKSMPVYRPAKPQMIYNPYVKQ
ncbi:MAG: hypothetical protein DRH04_05960 [Deltaproteobacteria bacterium]|nr:MAG: hypothetical protein DRH04_05960 [Deltaproteobacteria bacterium]